MEIENFAGWQDILSAAEANEKLQIPHFAYDTLAYSCLRMVFRAFANKEFSEAGKNKLVSSVFNTWCAAAAEMNDALEKGLHIEIVEDGNEVN